MRIASGAASTPCCALPFPVVLIGTISLISYKNSERTLFPLYIHVFSNYYLLRFAVQLMDKTAEEDAVLDIISSILVFWGDVTLTRDELENNSRAIGIEVFQYLTE